MLFPKAMRPSFTFLFSATRTPNSHNHSYLHSSLSKFTGKRFTIHSNLIHIFTPITPPSFGRSGMSHLRDSSIACPAVWSLVGISAPAKQFIAPLTFPTNTLHSPLRVTWSYETRCPQSCPNNLLRDSYPKNLLRLLFYLELTYIFWGYFQNSPDRANPEKLDLVNFRSSDWR